MILLVDSEGPAQIGWMRSMRRLIWAFAVRI